MDEKNKLRIEAITRNLRKFCEASGIEAAVVVFHWKGGWHGVASVNPHVCGVVESVDSAVREAIEKNEGGGMEFRFNPN